MRLVLVGPPGAGKGTQAEFIAEHFSIPKISTGDIFRSNVSGGTELGRMAKKYMDAGDLVPDEVTNAMVKDRLAEPDAANGFLLDGFPRNVPQAYELDGILNDLGSSLSVVLDLNVDHDEVVRRLSGPAVPGECHVLYAGHASERRLQDALAAMRGQPVLTVTERGQAGPGGVIRFLLQGGRVRFAIDKAAAQANGLSISSKLLSLASVIRGGGAVASQ